MSSRVRYLRVRRLTSMAAGVQPPAAVPIVPRCRQLPAETGVRPAIRWIGARKYVARRRRRSLRGLVAPTATSLLPRRAPECSTDPRSVRVRPRRSPSTGRPGTTGFCQCWLTRYRRLPSSARSTEQFPARAVN